LIRSPEPRQAFWQLGVLVIVREIQDDIRDKTSFNHTQQPTANVKGCLIGKSTLTHSDNTPSYHLNRDPDIGTKFLADELRWQFCKQERAVENCHAVIVIIGCEFQIRWGRLASEESNVMEYLLSIVPEMA
jgi:hypothetical protein